MQSVLQGRVTRESQYQQSEHRRFGEAPVRAITRSEARQRCPTLPFRDFLDMRLLGDWAGTNAQASQPVRTLRAQVCSARPSVALLSPALRLLLRSLQHMAVCNQSSLPGLFSPGLPEPSTQAELTSKPGVCVCGPFTSGGVNKGYQVSDPAWDCRIREFKKMT